jgi:hypothetical protein
LTARLIFASLVFASLALTSLVLTRLTTPTTTSAPAATLAAVGAIARRSLCRVDDDIACRIIRVVARCVAGCRIEGWRARRNALRIA